MKKIFQQVFRRDSISIDTNISSATNSKSTTPDKNDNYSLVISTSAQLLADAIQEILLNNQKLTGDDLSGFLDLVSLLSIDVDSQFEEELSKSLNSSTLELFVRKLKLMKGSKCLYILLKLSKYHFLVEYCRQVGLAASLINSMRLLRMLEIKNTKINAQEQKLDKSKTMSIGITFKASKNVTDLLSVLCSDPQTIEQLRPILLKLLCYPLSALPSMGVHLQPHCASVIKATCKYGLTTSIVWFLHDVQVISHMLNHLSELIASTLDEKHKLITEKVQHDDMWIIAIECIIDLLCYSAKISSSTILLSDFEAANGYKIFVNIIRNCSVEKSIIMMSIISRLLFDISKEIDEPICHPSMGNIFSLLLTEFIGIEIPIQREYGIDELIAISQDVYSRHAEFSEKEYLLQNLIFTLLTLYSNNSKNCTILEDNFNFLPTLIITYPSVYSDDISISIHKVLNYVCQCVENIAPPSIAALCATAVVELDMCLKLTSSTERDVAINKFVVICTSFENLIREKMQNAYIMLRFGMLKYLFCDPFEVLEKSISNGDIKSLENHQKIVFNKILDLLLVMIQYCPTILVELKRTTFLQIIRLLISNSSCDTEFTSSLIRLPEKLIYADFQNIEQNLLLLINLLASLRAEYTKAGCILSCINRILINQPEITNIWEKISGYSLLLDLMSGIKADLNSEDEDVSNRTFSFYKDLMCTITLTITMTNYLNNNIRSHNFHSNKAITNSQSSSEEESTSVLKPQTKIMTPTDSSNKTTKIKNLAISIVKIGIFSTRFSSLSIDLILELVSGYSNDPSITNNDGVILILELIDNLDQSTALELFQRLKMYATYKPEGIKYLCKAQFLKLVIMKFGDIFKNPYTKLTCEISDFLKSILKSYILSTDLFVFLNILVRPEIVLVNHRLLQPYLSFDYGNTISERDWFYVKEFLNLFGSNHNVSAVSNVVIDKKIESDDLFPYLVTNLSIDPVMKQFTWAKFSFSMWVKFLLTDMNTGIFTPIFAINSSDNYSFLEFHYNPSQSLIRMYSRNENHEYIFLDFRHYQSKVGWLHITVNCTNSGFFGILKPEISIFVNGVQSEMLNPNKTISKLEISTDKILELSIGRSYIGGMSYMSPFALGPFFFFDDVLFQSQCARIFLKGPEYRGIFQGETPLEDYLSTVISENLSKCDFGEKKVDEVLGILGLAGQELTVEPSLDKSAPYLIPKIPNPLIAYIPGRSETFTDVSYSKEDDSYDKKVNFSSSKKCFLPNVAGSDNFYLNAEVKGTNDISDNLSFSDAIASLGGPEILSPILHAASNSDQIKLYFQILKLTLNNSSNLKYFHRSGYRIVTSLLALKPVSILTPTIMNMIFNVCIHKNESINPPSILFTDSLAFFHLLLNHQIWDPSRRYYIENIIEIIRQMVSDKKYGFLNSQRLSKLGLVRWITLLVTRTADNYSSEYSGLFEVNASIEEIANGLDKMTPFLTTVIDELLSLISVIDIRKRDLELFSQVILYTLKGTNNELRDTLKAIDIVRFHFLRLLYTIFDMHTDGNTASFIPSRDKKGAGTYLPDSMIFQMFSSILNPSWYLTFIEAKGYDFASTSLLLKLLGLHLQRDALFFNGFVEISGFKIIESTFSGEEQPLCIILPLISIAFQVPMKFTPIPCTVDTGIKISRFLDLDETLGPTETFAPIIYLLLDLLRQPTTKSNSIGANPSRSKIALEVISVFFTKAFETNPALKEIMQMDETIDSVSRSFLMCTNAMTDGPKITLNPNTNSDLSIAIKENYFDDDSSITHTNGSDIDEVNEDFLNSPNTTNLSFNNNEGLKLYDFIDKILHDSIFQFRNPAILAYLFLSFPKQCPSSFVKDFQLLIFDKFKAVVDVIISTLDIEAFTILSYVFTYLIPLLRARVLDDFVLFQLLKLSIRVVRDITDQEIEKSIRDKLLNSTRDIGMSARYFALIALHAYAGINEGVVTEKFVYEEVRSSLHLLSIPFTEDTHEIPTYFARQKKDGALQHVGLQSLEGNGVFWLSSKKISVSDKKANSVIFQNAMQEKNLIASAFCSSLFLFCIDRLLNEEEILVVECTRIITLLMILKEKYMSKYFSSLFVNAKTTKGEMPGINMVNFQNNFNTLLPDDKIGYEAQLRFLDITEIENEESSHRTFFNWLDAYNQDLTKFFIQITTSLNQNLPSNEPIYNVFRRMQANRIRGSVNLRDVVSPGKRKENQIKIANQVSFNIKQWNLYGVANSAIGVIAWRKLWNSLQSSSLWSTNTLSGESYNNSRWKLNPLEGPERTRILLEPEDEEFNSEVKLPSKEELNENKGGIEAFLDAISKQGANRTVKNVDETTNESLSTNFEESSVDNSSAASVAESQATSSENFSTELNENLLDENTQSESVWDRPEEIFEENNLVSTKYNLNAQYISSVLMETMRGLIGQKQWLKVRMFNIQRISGLETQPALMLITPQTIHVFNNFEYTSSKIASINLNGYFEPDLRVKLIDVSPSDIPDNRSLLNKILVELIKTESSYKFIDLQDVYTIFKRRYQLKRRALEINDIRGNSFLFSCGSEQEMETVLKSLMEANMPGSVFQKYDGITNIPLGVKTYESVTSRFLSASTKLWLKGELSNFDYLMILNIASGRSFQDLTSYPVFPWIIADYKSETLNLSDPETFRDLSKPMGAIGDKRCQQFQERFDSLNDFRTPDSAPPFFYGTHYSCTGYVLHFLMRLQPFTQMAISLQGGQFDKADRLFRSIEHSWYSASQENIQDVRELIPEFYFLPDFLMNSNHFDLGHTQRGEAVDNVILPPWAQNSPKRFIELHRAALESKYVSENLHLWIDLIFGYKQRGPEAEKALNLFVHLTYDGAVDIDAISDPILKASTISQINNFGQTPSQLFTKPHPKRQVPDYFISSSSSSNSNIDSSSLIWHDNISPPLCTVGANLYCNLNKASFTQYNFRRDNRLIGIGDIISLSRDKIIASPIGVVFLKPKSSYYILCGPYSTGISIRQVLTNISLDDDKNISYHENLHFSPITCTLVNEDGSLLFTASSDTTIKIWNLRNYIATKKVEHLFTLTGHRDSILCLDYCSELSLLLSGSKDHSCILWDALSAKRVRTIGEYNNPVISVSINRIAGNILVLTSFDLWLYDVNGNIRANVKFFDFIYSGNVFSLATCVLAPPSGIWQSSVVAITGHEDGTVNLWMIKESKFYICHTVQKTHAAAISAIKLSSVFTARSKSIIKQTFESASTQDLLIGDNSGYVSRWTAYKLDQNADFVQILEKFSTKENSLYWKKS